MSPTAGLPKLAYTPTLRPTLPHSLGEDHAHSSPVSQLFRPPPYSMPGLTKNLSHKQADLDPQARTGILLGAFIDHPPPALQMACSSRDVSCSQSSPLTMNSGTSSTRPTDLSTGVVGSGLCPSVELGGWTQCMLPNSSEEVSSLAHD